MGTAFQIDRNGPSVESQLLSPLPFEIEARLSKCVGKIGICGHGMKLIDIIMDLWKYGGHEENHN
jgi:hypothetical protein